MIISITKLTVVSTRGANKRPCMGDVSFSDGKNYGWFLEPDETIRFSRSYVRHCVRERASFYSEKRQKLVKEYLDSNDVAVEVFRVEMKG